VPLASTPTATPIATSSSNHVRHKHHRKHKHSPTATPTPTPTATPPINLNTEDSVQPVTCNGPVKPPAAKPFLNPPYRGWTSLVSYFDHDSPNFAQDGLIITATGAEAGPDAQHRRTDFPGYWNKSLREYIDYDGHNGYDYNISYQSLYAAARGKVVFAAMEYPTMPDHGYGNMIMIEHRGGYVTLYGHLSKILVRRGQKVKLGQEIGISGNTGHSTGPHVHFTVFHNCTPVDPYGWSGSGPDPLQSYRGEYSVYLWRRVPLVINPPPGWPGMNHLPATSAGRLLLLRLPSTSRGTEAFSRSLRTEALQTLDALSTAGVGGSIDMLRGGIEVPGQVSAQMLYRLPHVASIESSDTVNGDRADMLAALARAALVTPHHRIQLNRKHTLNGYLLNYQGRILLVGKGVRGSRAVLKFSNGRHLETRRIVADPSNGAYAVDLGKLSTTQLRNVQRVLERGGAKVQVPKPKTRVVKRSRALVHHPRASDHSVLAWLWLVVLSCLALAAAAISTRPRWLALIQRHRETP